jgi:hypothetical protein
MGVLVDELELVNVEFGQVAVDQTLPWFVDLRRCFLHCNVKVLLHLCPSNIAHIKYEFKQVLQRLLGVRNDVFVTHDVNWNLGI